MKTPFENFYWLCGSSRAGKTTTSEYLEKEHNFYVYHFDDEVFGKLWKQELDPEKYPLICEIQKNNNDWEKYYSRPLSEILPECINIFKENWPLVLEDIKKIDTDKPVLVEGGGMFPEWVAEVASVDRILYYIPTKRFQRELFVKGMALEPGEEPQHEGQFFHAYTDTEYIVNQRIAHHDGMAVEMASQAKKLEIKYCMVDSYSDFEINRLVSLQMFV